MLRLPEDLAVFVPLLAVLGGVVAGLSLAHWVLLRQTRDLSPERKFPRQLALLGLTLVGLLVVVLALPVEQATRNHIIAFLGLLISGVFAFSSTTIMANLMAGVMLRVTKPFRTGDFVAVETYFGRVTGMGLLDTEIQTETRQLVALPNVVLVSKPVTVVRSSGTIISATLSLGYDVHHARVEEPLLRAARECGLEEPFVRILELGNFAVTYRISGLLNDVKRLLTVQSELHRRVLDVLHEEGIEILSPSYMAQRRVPEETRVIPPPPVVPTQAPSSSPEEIVFDKAEEAERIEQARFHLRKRVAELEAYLKTASPEEKRLLHDTIEQSQKQMAKLDAAPQDTIVVDVGKQQKPD